MGRRRKQKGRKLGQKPASKGQSVASDGVRKSIKREPRVIPWYYQQNYDLRPRPLQDIKQEIPEITEQPEVFLPQEPTMSDLEPEMTTRGDDNNCITNANETETEGQPEPVEETKRITKTFPFFHEYKTDCKYWGILPIKLDRMTAVQMTGSRLCHEIKQLLGGRLIFTEVERTNVADPNSAELICKVMELLSPKKKRLLATVNVAFGDDRKVFFTYSIDDIACAANGIINMNEVNVRVLKQACEIVYGTIVLRYEKDT